MASTGPILLREEEAKALVRQLGWSILGPVAVLFVGVFALQALPATTHSTVVMGGLVALLASMFVFFSLLGRLARGIGRSTANWCGSTFLLQKILLLLAWIIAWRLMAQAVEKAYRPVSF